MSDTPQRIIREDASASVLLALALRQLLGVRAPEDLPALRNLPVRAPDAAEPSAAVENQWQRFWDMTVEPLAHPSEGPLSLVDGFDDLVALPVTGSDELREAVAPVTEEALAYATAAHGRYLSSGPADGSFRAYASAIAEFEQEVGRPAHGFELNVQVLPFTQRGIWWVGALTVAVTDGLRRDVVAFDAAIRPVIAELA